MFYFCAGSQYETQAVIGCSRCLQTEADVMEWTDEKTFSLIALYEKHVCLYDVQSKDYHNRNVKKRAIEYLSTELGANG